ncbi:MAG: LURP-one-related family protein [Clostridiales bacterium]|nr:LURP-one-related family protein [Clostridiales bacterium]
MNLYIRQKVFSIGDKFDVYDFYGKTLYTVKGEVLTVGKKFHIFDSSGTEIAYIHQKVLSFKPRYFISRANIDIAQVVKEITFFKPVYTVPEFGWNIEGDFFNHNYLITSGNLNIASIRKAWVSWGDTYEVSVDSSADVINALCVVLIIDAVTAAQNNSGSYH